MDITINSGLKSLIRTLTETEYSGLEAAILRDGIREPLSVWDNDGKFILLDGHNRKKICDKHGIEYKTKVIKKVTVEGEDLDIDSLERAQIWVAHNQAGRRNLDQDGLAVLVAQVMPALAEDAKRRQAEKTKPSYGSENKEVNLDPKGSKSSPLESMVSAGDRVCFEQGRTLAKSFLGLGYEGKPNRRNEHRER